MVNMPLVSVLMPAYNSERYIAEAIDSILSQVYTNFELIIFDDGSSDGTRKVIESYNDSRIVKVLSNKNFGVVTARNEMIDRAKGKYIALIDADDIADPARLQKQVSVLEAGECDICGSAQWVLNEATGKIKQSKDKYTDADLRSLLIIYCTLCNSTVVGRSDIFKLFKYDASMLTSEDYLLWTRIAAAGYVFKNLRERLITYRVHSSQATATNFNQFRDSTDAVYMLYLKLLGLPKNLLPRQMPFQQRVIYGKALLQALNQKFPGMSYKANYEIYARFQFRKNRAWAILIKPERALFAFWARISRFVTSTF